MDRNRVEAVAGLCAGFSTTLLTHPLDFFKLRLQLDTSSPNQLTAFKKIYNQLVYSSSNNNGQLSYYKFIQNIYRGIGPNLIGSTSAWALYFYMYRQFKDLNLLIINKSNDDKHLKHYNYLLSAFLAGWSTSILTNPIWVIKTRMIAIDRSSPNAYKSIINGISNIYENEGLKGFYRGLVPALFNVAQGAVQLSIYDLLKRQISDNDDNDVNDGNNKSLTTIQYVYSSSISKMLSTSIFYPLQMIRSRLQILTTNPPNYSIIPLTVNIIRREGILAIYKGLPANLLRVVPATCITFLVYEKSKQILF